MQQRAFTINYNGLARVLLTKVNVCLPLTPDELRAQKVELKQYTAIWDTGATHSAITKKVADDLGLKATGIAEVRYGSGKASTNTYLVNIGLPNNVMISNVRVTEVNLIPDDNKDDNLQPQLLIGMDMIGMGDFAVTNQNGKTTLSFRMPSSTKIDFVPESNENNIMQGGNRHERRAFQAKQRRN